MDGSTKFGTYRRSFADVYLSAHGGHAIGSAMAVALGLPAIYKSRAVILIEQQDIPQDLVRSLVTSYADQRIQVISQRCSPMQLVGSSKSSDCT